MKKIILIFMLLTAPGIPTTDAASYWPLGKHEHAFETEADYKIYQNDLERAVSVVDIETIEKLLTKVKQQLFYRLQTNRKIPAVDKMAIRTNLEVLSRYYQLKPVIVKHLLRFFEIATAKQSYRQKQAVIFTELADFVEELKKMALTMEDKQRITDMIVQFEVLLSEYLADSIAPSFWQRFNRKIPQPVIMAIIGGLSVVASAGVSGLFMYSRHKQITQLLSDRLTETLTQFLQSEKTTELVELLTDKLSGFAQELIDSGKLDEYSDKAINLLERLAKGDIPESIGKQIQKLTDDATKAKKASELLKANKEEYDNKVLSIGKKLQKNKDDESLKASLDIYRDLSKKTASQIKKVEKEVSVANSVEGVVRNIFAGLLERK